jgi:hypothetical protein
VSRSPPAHPHMNAIIHTYNSTIHTTPIAVFNNSMFFEDDKCAKGICSNQWVATHMITLVTVLHILQERMNVIDCPPDILVRLA